MGSLQNTGSAKCYTHTNTKRFVLWRALNCVTRGNYILFYYYRGCAFCSTLTFTSTAVHSFDCLHCDRPVPRFWNSFLWTEKEKNWRENDTDSLHIGDPGLERIVVKPLKVFMHMRHAGEFITVKHKLHKPLISSMADGVYQCSLPHSYHTVMGPIANPHHWLMVRRNDTGNLNHRLLREYEMCSMRDIIASSVDRLLSFAKMKNVRFQYSLCES